MKNFILSWFCYKPKMTEKQVYEYFLNDVKNKAPDTITEKFYQGLDKNGIEKKIIDLDIKCYRRKSNNNLSRLEINTNYTSNMIQYIKRKLKRRLYEIYICIIARSKLDEY